MSGRHPEAVDGVALEIDLDQYDRFPADDPTVVPRFDCHNLRRFVFDDTTVRILDVNLAASQEANVGMHAQLGADDRLHVNGPSESGRVDHPLDACLTGRSNVELHVPEVTALRAFHRRQQRICGRSLRRAATHLAPVGLGC